ncbi:phospholipase [Colletotrichum cuscutae]|uniref:Phospholipase n=1 Tax=Colletotrichum cuscutae TaxID=1209917 RepID=A0AAI9VB27_9PEZI|nr:phospholipase [Colletotrichum cuscutae]
MAWLQLRTNAPGLQGAFVIEDRSVYHANCASKMLTFLTCPKSSMEDVSVKRLDPESFIVECPVFAAIQTRVKAGPVPAGFTRLFLERITSTPIVVKKLYAQILCPLSHVVALMVDDLGGLSKSAGVLASLMCNWRTLGMSPKPLLFVVTNNKGITEDIFVREVTLHCLERLRVLHPDTPPTYTHVKSEWTTNFESIAIVETEEENLYYHLVIFSEDILRQRRQKQFAFASDTLHRLVIQAICQIGSREEFNIVRSLRSQSQRISPSLFVPYALKLSSMKEEFPEFNWRSLIASSLAVDSHRPSHHVFQSDLVFEEEYESMLSCLALKARQPDLVASVKHDFCSMIAGAAANPESLLEVHLQLLKTHGEKLFPFQACAICFFRAATHTATCSHKVCNSCIDLLEMASNVMQYPTCRLCQKGEILIKPRDVAVRALILHGRTSRGTVSFLHRLRRALLGPLEEYFDIVIALDRGKFQTIMSSYGEPRKIQDRQLEVLEAELAKLWPSKPVLRVEHDKDSSRLKGNVQANMAFAALFHGVVSESPDSTCAHLTVFCSIPPGAHLQRIAMHARTKKMSLYYGDQEGWSQEDLCDISTWNCVRSGGAFTKRINVNQPDPGSIKAKIDDPFEMMDPSDIQVISRLTQTPRVETKEYDLPFQHLSEEVDFSEARRSLDRSNTSEEEFQLRPLIQKTELEEILATRDVPSVGSHSVLATDLFALKVWTRILRSGHHLSASIIFRACSLPLSGSLITVMLRSSNGLLLVRVFRALPINDSLMPDISKSIPPTLFLPMQNIWRNAMITLSRSWM